MKNTDLVEALAASISRTRFMKEPILEVVQPYNKEIWKEYINQFLVIIKPECLHHNNQNKDRALHIILDTLEQHNVTVSSAYTMNGRYISQNSLVENQYYMLNKFATYGSELLSSEVKRHLEVKYRDIKLIGAFSFLKMYPDYSEESLEKIAHVKGSEKIGNGSYLLRLNHDGIEYGILNAFHPFQKLHFSKEDGHIIVLECNSNIPYFHLDEKVIGNFNPSLSEENSVRRLLYNSQKELNLEISTIYNGVHVSPSPFEGMKALLHYSKKSNNRSIELHDTNLGSKLIRAGFKEYQISNLLKNPEVIGDENERLFLFDCLEGKGTPEIINFLEKRQGALL